MGTKSPSPRAVSTQDTHPMMSYLQISFEKSVHGILDDFGRYVDDRTIFHIFISIFLVIIFDNIF